MDGDAFVVAVADVQGAAVDPVGVTLTAAFGNDVVSEIKACHIESNEVKHKATRQSHALRHALNHTSCHVHIIEINNILILAAPHSIVHHWMQPTKPAGAPLMSSLDIHRNRRHAADCYLCPQSNISNHWHHSEAPIQWLST